MENLTIDSFEKGAYLCHEKQLGTMIEIRPLEVEIKFRTTGEKKSYSKKYMNECLSKGITRRCNMLFAPNPFPRATDLDNLCQ